MKRISLLLFTLVVCMFFSTTAMANTGNVIAFSPFAEGAARLSGNAHLTGALTKVHYVNGIKYVFALDTTYGLTIWNDADSYTVLRPANNSLYYNDACKLTGDDIIMSDAQVSYGDTMVINDVTNESGNTRVYVYFSYMKRWTVTDGTTTTYNTTPVIRKVDVTDITNSIVNEYGEEEIGKPTLIATYSGLGTRSVTTGAYSTQWYIGSLAIKGNKLIAFGRNSAGSRIITFDAIATGDVTTPTASYKASNLDANTIVREIDDNYLYLSNPGNSAVTVYRIPVSWSNLVNDTTASYITTVFNHVNTTAKSNHRVNTCLNNGLLYISTYVPNETSWSEVKIINVSTMTEVASITNSSWRPIGMTVENNTLYVASGSGGVYAYDISTPSNPILVGYGATVALLNGRISVSGGRIYSFSGGEVVLTYTDKFSFSGNTATMKGLYVNNLNATTENCKVIVAMYNGNQLENIRSVDVTNLPTGLSKVTTTLPSITKPSGSTATYKLKAFVFNNLDGMVPLLKNPIIDTY